MGLIEHAFTPYNCWISTGKKITQKYLHASTTPPKYHGMGDTNRTTNYSAHTVSVYIRVEVADAAVAAATKHKTQYKYEKHKIKCDKKTIY